MARLLYSVNPWVWYLLRGQLRLAVLIPDLCEQQWANRWSNAIVFLWETKLWPPTELLQTNNTSEIPCEAESATKETQINTNSTTHDMAHYKLSFSQGAHSYVHGCVFVLYVSQRWALSGLVIRNVFLNKPDKQAKAKQRALRITDVGVLNKLMLELQFTSYEQPN